MARRKVEAGAPLPCDALVPTLPETQTAHQAQGQLSPLTGHVRYIADPDARVLSIDASTECTGYAFMQDARLLWSMADDTHGYHNDISKVLRHYFLTLKNLIEAYQPTVIIIEDVVAFNLHSQGMTVVSLARLSAIPFLVSKAIPVYRVNVSSWKARVVGNGRAKKQASVVYVKETFGLDVGNDEGDAICLACMYYIGREKLK